MASPTILGLSGGAADSHFILGALTVTVSIIAMAEVVRAARYANLVIAVILILCGVINQYQGMTSDIITAVALAGFCIPRGALGKVMASGIGISSRCFMFFF